MADPIDNSAVIDVHRFFANLMRFRADLLQSVPEDQRTKQVTKSSCMFIDDLVRQCEEIGLDYHTRILRHTLHAPSYAEAYMICGQILESLKRKHPTLFPAKEQEK